MSSLALPLVTIVVTITLMEVFAITAHKYIMHGWGWNWHRSHHEPHNNRFEKNDLYALVFASVAVVLFWIGANVWPFAWWIAIGITSYGFLYFVAHDGLVHQRWPFRYVPKSGYLKRLYQAHRLHHAVKGKQGCVSFGFLWAPSVESLKGQLKRNSSRLSLAFYKGAEGRE